MDTPRASMLVALVLLLGCSSSEEATPGGTDAAGDAAACVNVSAAYGPACSVRTDGGYPFAWTCPPGVARDAGIPPLVTGGVGGALLCAEYAGADDGGAVYCCPAPVDYDARLSE